MSASNTGSDYGTGKKTFSVYFSGFLLCIVLTLIPFAAVAYHLFSRHMIFFTLFVCAILQFLVQTACFLRLTTSTEQGKVNILSFVFTIVVLIAIIGGSLWIMYHLNYNMMH